MKRKPTMKIMAMRLPESIVAYVRQVAADSGVKPGTTLRDFVIRGAQEHMRQSGRKNAASV